MFRRLRRADRLFAVVLTIAAAGGSPWWWPLVFGRPGAPGGTPSLVGFSGGCPRYQIFAQDRWRPRGTAIRSSPDVNSTQVGSFPGNMSIAVNGWVRARPAYPSDQPPFDSDIWFHLADGAGWVAFGGVRETPVKFDSTGLAAGARAPTPAACHGAVQ